MYFDSNLTRPKRNQFLSPLTQWFSIFSQNNLKFAQGMLNDKKNSSEGTQIANFCFREISNANTD